MGEKREAERRKDAAAMVRTLKKISTWRGLEEEYEESVEEKEVEEGEGVQAQEETPR